MRDTTERREGVDSGVLKLVGTNYDTIYSVFTKLLDDKNVYLRMSTKTINPYGNGHVGKRVTDIIEGKKVSRMRMLIYFYHSYR